MIRIEHDISILANKLVPESIQYNSPQFYELVKAFLENIKSINENVDTQFVYFLDLDTMTEEDIIKRYLKVFMGSMDVDAFEVYPDTVVLKISKELSSSKGRLKTYKFLSDLLLYLLPDVKLYYYDLQEQLETITDPEQRKALLEETRQLESEYTRSAYLDYFEVFDEFGELVPFKYKIITDFEQDTFMEYIYPFCHPLGWEMEFERTFDFTLTDTYDEFGDDFQVQSIKKRDYWIIGDTRYLIGDSDNNYYNTNGYLMYIGNYPVIGSSSYDENDFSIGGKWVIGTKWEKFYLEDYFLEIGEEV